MDQSRYRDKAYLVTYDLTADMFDAFNLKVDDIVPVRSVYILYTDKGVKILKKVNYALEELEYINSVINHIISRGYDYVVPFMNTIYGKPYITRDDGTYVMLDLIEGREADFGNPIDTGGIAKALCSLHKSTWGFNRGIEKRNYLYKWIPSFTRAGEELLIYREIAQMHENKTEFDELFLESVEKHYKQTADSIKLLRNSAYLSLCREVEDNRNICHHDLAYHNIIIDNAENIYFVDFDFCIMDLRIHDIANLIVKSIKHYNWDTAKAESIIDNYSSVDELRGEELQVLYGFLTFPQDFYEISRQYYARTKKWDEEDFLSRLQRKAGYFDERTAFLEGIKNKLYSV